MIDLHFHILPGIDDGPATMSESLSLARAAVACGTERLVATPHVSHEYPNRPDEISWAVAALREELVRNDIPLLVDIGAEIAIDVIGQLTVEELDGLRMGDGPFLMIECPLSSNASDPELAVMSLLEKGRRVVLAHPERSPLLQRDRAQLERLVASGALVSVTASSIEGVFGRTAQRMAHELLREGRVHNVVSDAHDEHRRPPGLGPPLTAEGGALSNGDLVRWLTETVPEAVLDGGPLSLAPASAGVGDSGPRARRGLSSWLWPRRRAR